MSLKLEVMRNAKKIRQQLFPSSLESDVNLLRESGYFDSSWYQQNNPDVVNRGVDPLRHYLLYGGLEGRSPGPKYDSYGYLHNNPNVHKSGVNSLVHYLKFGRAEGRSPYGKDHESEIIADMRVLQTRYLENFDRPINFYHPTTYSEKLQILKLAYRSPIMTKFADKAVARELVSQIIGKQYLVPSIGIYDCFEDIPQGKLPNQFVLKANHGSGYNLICWDKKSLDWYGVEQKARTWLASDFYLVSREWCYKNITRKLVIEKLINEAGRIPPDIKLHVYDGKVKEIQFIFDRDIGDVSTIHLTSDWQVLPYSLNMPAYPYPVAPPKQKDQIIYLAEKLGAGFPQVRVDFILASKQVYFSEMTFYPATGLFPFKPPEWDQILGHRINLDNVYDAKYFGALSDAIFE